MKTLLKTSCVLGAWMLGLTWAQAQTQQLVLGYGTPTEVNVAAGTAATNVGTPGNYRVIILEDSGGAGVCASWSGAAITAPSGGKCSVGFYLEPGIPQEYVSSFGMMPNSQLKVIATSATTDNVYEFTQ